ncbi:STAS/SEC14 domain-containing protein [Haloferula sargassicola]|uniref:STAS/SEC14 domain-containing protein n=1 Tax=Haloferula sargassicola TaxID=490096 RepID=A0ABP9UN07_9BACT
MHQILPETRDDVVALRLSGKLDATDYESIIPTLESHIEHHGKIRVFWEMIDCDGWTIEGFGKDVGFDVRHANDLSKIAIVGDKKWEKWMSGLMKPFTSAEIRYFPISDRLSALTWIQSHE